MNYFSSYTSNTCAGSGNQLLFDTPVGVRRTGRLYYKITHGGTYHYSILFSNTVDSTFGDGSQCRRNVPGGHWQIIQARIGKTACIGTNFTALSAANELNRHVGDFQPILFDEKPGRDVLPGAMFHSDPVPVSFAEGEYLCLEITYTGCGIPYHEESQLPVFIRQGDDWVYSKHLPFASMIGCDRKAAARIGYLGDSITQGCGTGMNTYTHWNAVLSNLLGPNYAYWNLGLGYARANDMATDGTWLYRAKQNDLVVLCCGVNDIGYGHSEAQIREDITRVVTLLNDAGVSVILQTIPPFDYSGDNIEKWLHLNQYIRTTLSKKVEMVFDVVPYLCQDADHPHLAKFGGHSNADGCRVWADALFRAIRENQLL